MGKGAKAARRTLHALDIPRHERLVYASMGASGALELRREVKPTAADDSALWARWRAAVTGRGIARLLGTRTPRETHARLAARGSAVLELPGGARVLVTRAAERLRLPKVGTWRGWAVWDIGP